MSSKRGPSRGRAWSLSPSRHIADVVATGVASCRWTSRGRWNGSTTSSAVVRYPPGCCYSGKGKAVNQPIRAQRNCTINSPCCRPCRATFLVVLAVAAVVQEAHLAHPLHPTHTVSGVVPEYEGRVRVVSTAYMPALTALRGQSPPHFVPLLGTPRSQPKKDTSVTDGSKNGIRGRQV